MAGPFALTNDLRGTMKLSKRPPVSTLPSYSLTGDLLGFLRCGLQYRYIRIGKLPPTNPVQMWFGQFIHGVLEEGYRRYQSTADLPPWSDEDVREIIDLIKRRLAAQKLFPWSESLEQLADRRAYVALNELGPELFPLIHRAEVRLRGARLLPLDKIPEKYQIHELDRYEMVGVVDVISHVTLFDPAFKKNKIVRAILEGVGSHLPESFEVILDYKGMRRHADTGSWKEYAWQVQTYAHLRKMHDDSLPVVAGVLVYVNELFATWDDLASLRKEIQETKTAIVPVPGSEDEAILGSHPPKKRRHGDLRYPKQMSLDYRLRRALRVIPVTEETIQESLAGFDEVVARIEICRGKEQFHGRVTSTWETNATEENIDTCKACDSRTFCPDYREESRPKLPGVSKKRGKE